MMENPNKNSFEMENTGKFVVHFDKSKNIKKNILPIVGGLALCAYVVLFNVEKFRELIPADNAFDNFMDNVFVPFAKVLSYIIIPLLVFVLIANLKKFSSINYLLCMDENGFEENISNKSLGFVEWSSVDKLEVKPFFNVKFFAITLKSTEKYYKNDRNQTIMFTSQLFNDRADEVEQIIRHHIDKSKK